MGNSNPEVRSWAAAAMAQKDRPGRVVMAGSVAAYGILDGLHALGFLRVA